MIIIRRLTKLCLKFYKKLYQFRIIYLHPVFLKSHYKQSLLEVVLLGMKLFTFPVCSASLDDSGVDDRRGRDI